MRITKFQRRKKIKNRCYSKVFGTSRRPRLSVFRSNAEIYAQLIDDESKITLCSFNSRQISDKKGMKKSDISKMVGVKVAEKILQKGLKEIVFDRNGFLYHGRVKALADGARETGLVF